MAKKAQSEEWATTPPEPGNNRRIRISMSDLACYRWLRTGMVVIIPQQLAVNCRKTPGRTAWLNKLPVVVKELTDRWSLHLGHPFEHHLVSCSWVAPVVRGDGTAAVLKMGMPHMEGEHEIEGLRLWNGNPTVQLVQADDALGAMLLERCQPGYMLRCEPEDRQDAVIAALLKRLWQVPASADALQRFRHLSEMLEFWRRETLAQEKFWPDAGLVREGLRLLQELGRPSSTDTLLATDLHAGNVLRSEREPWIVIDPKPFIGDRAYDLVQHLHNCEARLHQDPIGMVKRLADLADVDRDSLRLWTFARAAADPRDDWSNMVWMSTAKALAL